MENKYSLQQVLYIAITAVIIFAGLSGVVGYRLGENKNINKAPQYPAPTIEPNPTIDQGGVACAMDARICPDGSAVGRIPPNCEFAPCPPSSKNNDCINHLGEPQDSGACANLPSEARSCNTNEDCAATCSKGCVSSVWMSNNTFADCAAMPEYTCMCVSGECKAKK